MPLARRPVPGWVLERGDLSAIERELADAFAELSVAPLRAIETGFGSVVVETADGVIFRVPRHERVARARARQARLLAALAARLPVAVPQPEWLVEARAHLPYGAAGHRRLPGEQLSPEGIRRGGETRLATEVADFLVALHSFPIEEARDLGVPEADADGGEFEALRAEVLALLRDVLSPAEYRVVVAWSDTFLADETINRFPPVVRHGDLWYGNLLVDTPTMRLTAVLDWDSAAIGDAAWDLARQLHLGERFAAAVLREYGRRRQGDTGLAHRMRRRWELLEFEGVRTAAELDDAEELDETIAKLRAGPIFDVPRPA